MYAYQITRHGRDVNGNTRYAITLFNQTEWGNLRARIRLFGGHEMIGAFDRERSGDWITIEEGKGQPTRRAQRSTPSPTCQLLAWHHVADRIDLPPHALIAHASNAADDVAGVTS